jgi:hypothetical protein
MAQKINAAYDTLEAIAQSKGAPFGIDAEWLAYAAVRQKDWEKSFRKDWVQAYRKTHLNEHYPGLHLGSCVENWRRGWQSPPPLWFRGALFEDTPENRRKYRAHLLEIAPNPAMAEVWARKSFNLEFGDGSWVFYITPAKLALTF